MQEIQCALHKPVFLSLAACNFGQTFMKPNNISGNVNPICDNKPALSWRVCGICLLY